MGETAAVADDVIYRTDITQGQAEPPEQPGGGPSHPDGSWWQTSRRRSCHRANPRPGDPKADNPGLEPRPASPQLEP